MKSVSIVLLLALAAATPTLAADPPKGPAATADKSKAAAKPEDKLICRREETGSFIAKRVCKTQAQIDQERRDAQQIKDDRDVISGRPDR